MIRPNTAAALRAAIPPRDFYRAELPLDREPGGCGWVTWGLCPFHPDRHAGSFRVNLATGGFFCHACEAGGKSIIDFVILRGGLNFREALARLRRDWGR